MDYTNGSPRRFVVELVADDDCDIRGEVIPEGSPRRVPFSGWLDFFRVWEALAPRRVEPGFGRRRLLGRTFSGGERDDGTPLA